PYHKVENGRVDKSVDALYLTAEEEEDMLIGQANMPMDDEGTIDGERTIARMEGDFPVVNTNELHYTDVAPNQISSISASLIPFLEHNDANRALMGSNMMRQAVPLLRVDSPIVGTGLERQVAADSRVLMNAEGAGTVEYVDAEKIIIKYDRTDKERMVSFDSEEKEYNMFKFRNTNHSTSVNIKHNVSVDNSV